VSEVGSVVAEPTCGDVRLTRDYVMYRWGISAAYKTWAQEGAVKTLQLFGDVRNQFHTRCVWS
jgi:hypothetical protein